MKRVIEMEFCSTVQITLANEPARHDIIIMSLSRDEIGLCRNCQNVRRVKTNRGTVFYLCRLSETYPRFPQYPRLPVLACEGYVPAAGGHDQPEPGNLPGAGSSTSNESDSAPKK